MKILITENKRYQLAYKILDNVLEGLTREDYDLNRDTDSIFSNHQILFDDKNGKTVMRYTEKYDRLEVRYGIWEPLRIFSFSDEELERVIHWWFTNRIRIEPDSVMIIGNGDYD
jgi:hypothetical protein